MIRRKYVVLFLLTLVSVPLAGLLYSNLAQAQSTVTGYVSVPAAAFVPVNTSWASIIIDGIIPTEYNRTTRFAGSVQLPHGATVTNLTFWWYDTGPSTAECRLYRYNEADNQLMANASSTIYLYWWNSSYDDTIDYATVDNSEYAYWLDVSLPPDICEGGDGTYWYRHAIIEYTLPSGAVGGFWIPVDKFSLLAPYIALVATIILAVSISVAYVKYRKKQ